MLAAIAQTRVRATEPTAGLRSAPPALALVLVLVLVSRRQGLPLLLLSQPPAPAEELRLKSAQEKSKPQAASKKVEQHEHHRYRRIAGAERRYRRSLFLARGRHHFSGRAFQVSRKSTIHFKPLTGRRNHGGQQRAPAYQPRRYARGTACCSAGGHGFGGSHACAVCTRAGDHLRASWHTAARLFPASPLRSARADCFVAVRRSFLASSRC